MVASNYQVCSHHFSADQLIEVNVWNVLTDNAIPNRNLAAHIAVPAEEDIIINVVEQVPAPWVDHYLVMEANAETQKKQSEHLILLCVPFFMKKYFANINALLIGDVSHFKGDILAEEAVASHRKYKKGPNK